MKKLNAQERVFEIVRLLVENHIEGLTNKELAQKLGTSEVNICRDLALFEQYRWVTRGTKNVWRLSAEFGGTRHGRGRVPCRGTVAKSAAPQTLKCKRMRCKYGKHICG